MVVADGCRRSRLPVDEKSRKKAARKVDRAAVPATLNGLRRPLEPGVCTSIAFTDRLVDEGIDPSVGSVGDAYDNSLAESPIGLSKSELIHHEGPWRDVDQVEAGTAGWVQWFNTDRTHGSIDDLTPLELEALDYARSEPLERAGLTPAIRSPDTPGGLTAHLRAIVGDVPKASLSD